MVYAIVAGLFQLFLIDQRSQFQHLRGITVQTAVFEFYRRHTSFLWQILGIGKRSEA
jgi:hypothetical protein